MTDAALELAEYIIADHEGCVSHVYEDTAGFWTIGYGRMIDKRLGGGVTEDEAHALLVNDIERANVELRTAFPWFHHLDDKRRAALIDMHHNLGLPRLQSFTRMIAHLEHYEFEAAAREALDSKWARQVGKRATDIANMIRGGPASG